MALTASMGQQFVLTAEMDAAAAATYTIANPVGAVQSGTGNTSFTIVRVEVPMAAFDGATATSTVQIAHLDSALTATDLFAAALNALPAGVRIMPSLTPATYVAEAVPDNSVATSTVFTELIKSASQLLMQIPRSTFVCIALQRNNPNCIVGQLTMADKSTGHTKRFLNRIKRTHGRAGL